MHHDPSHHPLAEAPERLSQIARAATDLARRNLEFQSLLQALDDNCRAQAEAVRMLTSRGDRMRSAVRDAIDTTTETRTLADTTIDRMQRSLQRLAASGTLSKDLAHWVNDVHSGSGDVDSMLVAVRKSNSEIASIASQVNILAMTAKIEAARAGDAGRVFAIVAEAINDLSHKTRSAVEDISATIKRMSGWITDLNDGARTTAASAQTLLDQVETGDADLSEIGARMAQLRDAAHKTQGDVASAQHAADELLPTVATIGASVDELAGGVCAAKTRTNALIDCSESILQDVVSLGGSGEDAPMIVIAQNVAGPRYPNCSAKP